MSLLSGALAPARLSPHRPFLESVLTPERYRHCLGTMELAGELAELYDLDEEPLMTAGLLHDAAKDLTQAQQLALVEDAGFELRYSCERVPLYLHAPASACLVARELGVTHSLVLDAIASHSFSGEVDALESPFGWCLRFADILAPVRPWEGMDKLRRVVFAGRLEEGALLHVVWLIEYVRRLDVPVHPNLFILRDRLTRRLRPTEDFLGRV
jgi:predicted HD superfamily hydrolase involved in NAD metabolism